MKARRRHRRFGMPRLSNSSHERIISPVGILISTCWFSGNRSRIGMNLKEIPLKATARDVS